MKVCFVVQRYGLEVNGGAEAYTREVAEHLAKLPGYEVSCLTTCAVDYTTWKNEYAPGEEMVNGVLVHRFPVDRVRDKDYFEEFSKGIVGNPYHTYADEAEWIEEQGPVSSQLLAALEEHYDEYNRCS